MKHQEVREDVLIMASTPSFFDVIVLNYDVLVATRELQLFNTYAINW